MELTESIETINESLRNLYGIDTITGRPIFRVVSSWDQFENRLIHETPEGLQLLSPIIREVPKYDQRDLDWKDKYILERLVLVPIQDEQELGVKQSYEPLWVFRDEKLNPLPPITRACCFVINTMYAALGKKSLAKYVDEEAKNPIEKREERIAKYTEELFGDESFLLGRTVTGEAIAMPKNYEKETKQ